jgi:dTDP-4-dehydrorhamnose reductase
MKNKKKKVFIVGSNGFLGKSLKDKLKKNKNYKLLNYPSNKKIDFSNINICNKILIFLLPDIIINCAAKIDVDFCEKNKKIAYNSNAKIVKNLTNFCNKNNKKLIHISTDHVYNDASQLNKENNISTTNYYAQSKLYGEKFAVKTKSLILRTNFFGYSRIKKKKTLINWILLSAKNKKKIYIYKNIFFSPLYIETLTSILIKILNTKKTGIFNLGSKNKISKSNFILKISKKLHVKLNYKKINFKLFTKSKAERPLGMAMNSSKFEKTFSIKLPTIQTEINKLSIK